jgi:hypothetical protein
MKENDGGGGFKYDIIDNIVRTSVNITMHPHQHNNKKRNL